MTANRRQSLPGYPLPGYNGHTTDAERCPRCGSIEITLLGRATSRRRIGLCANCGENYIVEPEPQP